MKITDKKLICLSFGLFAVFILMYLGSGSQAESFAEEELIKNEPTLGDKQYTLVVNVGDEELGEVDITVPERKYTKEECEEMSGNCREDALKAILDENTDFTDIESDLSFFTELDGYPFTFSFETDTPEKIDDDGRILSCDDFDSVITATYIYEEFEDNFVLKVHVVPGPYVKARVYRNILMATVEDSLNVNDDCVKLPTELDGEKVSYSLPSTKKNPVYLILAPISVVALLIGKNRDERKKGEKRKEEILQEYPVLLQKMALYLATGMTIRNIFTVIYDEGILKHENNPMYEEMGISVNELKSGISEGIVYKRFGERTGTPELVRFTALLSQNLKKGSSRLKDLLDEESTKAFVLKKQRAIKAGEEAGTKLLFPMMLLLVDILVMIMVPAFISI